jgi:hypothetical protein
VVKPVEGDSYRFGFPRDRLLPLELDTPWGIPGSVLGEIVGDSGEDYPEETSSGEEYPEETSGCRGKHPHWWQRFFWSILLNCP